MESWVYTQGKLKGLEEGKKDGIAEGQAASTQRTLRSLFERRLGRAPALEEEQAIVRRARELAPEKLVEVFEMPIDKLVAWLLGSG